MTRRRISIAPHWAYLAACTLTVLAIALLGWWTAWRLFGVPTLEPVFADLRTIQAGLGAQRAGLDPQVVNPGDRWGRAMNYPSIWLGIARVLHWEREGNYLAFAIAADLAFVACCFDLIRRTRSWWIAALALSGACAFGLERGNNDLVVFVLLYVSAVAARPLFAALVPLATVLKIFPMLALAAFVHRPRLALLAAVLCAAALAILAPELALIRKTTANVLAADIAMANPALATGNVMSYGAVRYADALAELGFAVAPTIVCAVLLGLALLLHFGAPRLFRTGPADEMVATLFLCGSAIFLGSTLIGPNWDYRLSFLLMALPLIAALEMRTMRLVLPGLMLFAGAMPLLDGFAGQPGWLLNLAAKAALFVLLSPLMLRTLTARLPRQVQC